MNIPSATKDLQNGQIVFGNDIKSCNALHDRKHYFPDVWHFMSFIFGQNESCETRNYMM